MQKQSKMSEKNQNCFVKRCQKKSEKVKTKYKEIEKSERSKKVKKKVRVVREIRKFRKNTNKTKNMRSQ